MNDVPIRSVNGTRLRAPNYVFGDHERDHHSHMKIAKYTHFVNPEYQASFQWGYSMLSYEEWSSLIKRRVSHGCWSIDLCISAMAVTTVYLLRVVIIVVPDIF